MKNKRELRLELILEYLETNHSATVIGLSEAFRVSKTTIRQDLDELYGRGRLIRTHGGGVPVSSNPLAALPLCPMPRDEDIPHLSAKKALAREAVKLIREDDSIFLGGGSTFYILARYLKPYRNLNVVTTNISAVYELAPYLDHIYFIGGELVEMDGIYYTGGPKLPLELDKVFVNKAFVGVSGIDLNAGLTIYDLTQFSMYTSVRSIANEIILLCDWSKFGHQSAHRIGTIQGFAGTVITNRKTAPEYTDALKKMGIRLLTA